MPRKTETAPDWTHWKRLDEWDLKAAVCLLLSIDPHGDTGVYFQSYLHWDEIEAGNRSPKPSQRDDQAAQFKRLLDYAWTSYHAGKLCLKIPQSADNETRISATEFVEWARSKGFSIPEPLDNLLPKPEPTPKAAAVKAPAKQHKTADPRKLETLLKLLLAIARAKYDWSSAQRNTATGTKEGSIHAAVIRELGQEHEISEDTIRRLLIEAESAVSK